MILKTKVFIAKEDISKLSDEEKDAYQAKKEYMGDDFKDDDVIYTVQPTDAIIDTILNHLYIDMGEGNIRLRPLLAPDIIGTESRNDYAYPIVSFTGNLEEIYEQLIKENI